MLLYVFRNHIDSVKSNSILDDFLQEELIKIEEHEHIASLEDRTEAAAKLLDVFEKDLSMPRLKQLVSILKLYKINNLDQLKEIKEKNAGLVSPYGTSKLEYIFMTSNFFYFKGLFIVVI